ncbi:MAG TPA: MerR family transcriptional regulator [Streptosporangiaceae bacterium]|nr:MerR family transcriptional regulator [Streptosporangiaceae bacterium]
MTKTTGEDMTIDALARQAQLPVRTIREYHTMRLLPPPERRGRVGFYGPRHSQRLELITRLQRRGYSLAGIRDLLQAWQEGTDLTSLLGVEPGGALDETPLRLSRAELEERIPALSGQALSDATAAGLIHPDGDDFYVRSPALLGFVADGAAAGLPLPDLLELASAVRDHLGALAEVMADIIVDRLLPARSGNLAPLLQRARMLLAQGAASILADQLGAALRKRPADTEAGAALRAAIEQISVGAVADTAGRIRPARGAQPAT